MKFLRRLRDQLHLVFSLYGVVRYRRRFNKLCIIAVTGTDGKSSTVIYLAKLLRKGGIKIAHYSSVSYSNGELEVTNRMKMTTPGRAKLYEFLSSAQQNGCSHAVIEVTSEGIRQWRVFGISFDIVVYTNITPEHIERHGSFEAYRATKLSLLKQLRTRAAKTTTGSGVIFSSADDTELQECIGDLPNHVPVSRLRSASHNPFSMLNYGLALAVASECGVHTELTDDELKVPGRFEIFYGPRNVIVDYAHTPHALDMCLSAARGMAKNKIIHVFGAAGGGRDKWKRPLLARISEQHSDIHIITEENSFDEEVSDILSDIKKGFSDQATVHVEPDRRRAIQLAFSLADSNDLIVATAKGSETVIAGKMGIHHPYNERSFVQQCQQSVT